MSHITVGKGGADNVVITDMAAVRLAAQQLGLTVLEQQEYRWFGRFVGDSPAPAGWNVEEMGKNAAFVLRLNDEQAAKARQQYGGEPYDLALIKAEGGGYYLA